MAEIKGDRVFIFGKDATDLVDLLSEIVYRRLQEEAQQETSERKSPNDPQGDERPSSKSLAIGEPRK